MGTFRLPICLFLGVASGCLTSRSSVKSNASTTQSGQNGVTADAYFVLADATAGAISLTAAGQSAACSDGTTAASCSAEAIDTSGLAFNWTPGEWSQRLAERPLVRGHFNSQTFVVSELWHRSVDGPAGATTYQVTANAQCAPSCFTATPVTGGSAIALATISDPFARQAAAFAPFISAGTITGTSLSPAPYFIRFQATTSAIQNVVVVMQENHTFDSYFGDRCQGSPGVTCNQGWNCCESIWGSNAPWTEVATGGSVMELTDELNGCHDPDHNTELELDHMDLSPTGFLMDAYPDPTELPCLFGNETSTVRYDGGSGTLLQGYWNMAQAGALADRYFQPISGASSSNDMFFARASFVYQDNQASPNDVDGGFCHGYDNGTTVNAANAQTGISSYLREYQDLTIGDWLDKSGVAWTTYMEGYDAVVAIGHGQCPSAPASNPLAYRYPFFWDPSDNPFSYYPSSRDNPTFMRDLTQLNTDLAAGTLPRFVFIRSLGTHSEHPEVSSAIWPTTISDGQTFATSLVSQIQNDPVYGPRTLILLTWDEGGGFYDHVPPPQIMADGTALPAANLSNSTAVTTDGIARPTSASDPECFRCEEASAALGQEYYGTRIPFIAIGPYARQNWISHQEMEHSSIVKFLEWNFLGGHSGQLGTRDAHVNNLGSLLVDSPAVIGTAVPTGVSD